MTTAGVGWWNAMTVLGIGRSSFTDKAQIAIGCQR